MRNMGDSVHYLLDLGIGVAKIREIDAGECQVGNHSISDLVDIKDTHMIPAMPKGY